MSVKDQAAQFLRLVQIMARLRSPEGCPWDREQTPESLAPYLVEETYEVLEAIDRGEPAAVCEELGDLLLQVVFIARIFEERDAFAIADVAESIADKLVRRHPHVFSGRPLRDRKELEADWHRIKSEEKGQTQEMTGILAGVPSRLPALMRARKLTEKASRAGFDWPDLDGVMAKVHEELEELARSIRTAEEDAVQDELGDLLFAVVNLGRFLRVDAENALRKTIDRFVRRFAHIENTLAAQGRDLARTSLEEMDQLWEEAKVRERKKPSPLTKT